jgi:tight adherence protein B
VTHPSHHPSRRTAAVRLWWSLTAVALVLGIGSLSIGDAGAQKSSGSGEVTVDRVDATGDVVIADGSVTGGDPSSLEVSSSGTPIEPGDIATTGKGLRNDVVAVIDTTETLGNATVQLAKQGLDPLMPGAGATTSLGVVSTGGAAVVQVGPTTSASEVAAGLDNVEPQGTTSATWDGLSRAAALLDDRSPDSVGTVVLFSAATEPLDPAAVSRARSDLQQAGVRLDVVAMSKGTNVEALSEMVATLGGTISVVRSDEQLAGAFEGIAQGLEGRFRLSFPSPDGADALVPLTIASGDASALLAYADDAVRTGSEALAPVASDGGGGFLANPVVKWLALLLGVAAVMMLVWAVAMMVLPDENDLTRRLEVYDESYGADPSEFDDPIDDSSVSVPIIKKAVEFTGEMAERRGVLDKVEVMLERANMPLRAPEAMFFTGIIAAILVVLTFFVTGNVLVALVVAVVAAFLPSAVLNFKIRKRQKAFVKQLPDMLTLLSGTLKAGYSIGQGFESVSTEVEDPMGRELRRVVTETRLGRSLEESLDAVAERMDSDDFSWAVMAIRIQREVGGNLAELLMTVADTMTQRERLRREVSTLTAEGKMSAIIIGALPPVLAVVMYVMNPSYIKELFSPGLGYALLAGAVVMMGIGFAWMKKTITIEV